MTVLSITVLGATLFFLVNAPFSGMFEFRNASVGAVWPLLTVFQTMLGLPGGIIIDDTTTGGVMIMLVFFSAPLTATHCHSPSSPASDLPMMS
eukprot:SAG22_NODE_1346_length_4674_cov_2.003934_3_plen_93_part_00